MNINKTARRKADAAGRSIYPLMPLPHLYYTRKGRERVSIYNTRGWWE